MEEGDYYATKYNITIEDYYLSKPILITPAGGAVITDTSPLLEWNEVDLAQGYHVQIATVPDFETAIAVDDFGVDVSPYTVSSLLLNGTRYYWRVQAKNVLDIWREWSDAETFTVYIAPPSIPSPAHETTSIDTTPLLSWEQVPQVLSYHLEVNTNISFTGAGVCNESDLTEYSYQISNLLETGLTYYWRVRSTNEDEVSGNWSDTWSFSIYIPAPALAAPSDGNVTIDSTPLLSWEDIPGSSTYHLEVNTNNTFTGTSVCDEPNLIDFSYQVLTPLLDGTTCFWRVSTKNEDGISGEWGPTWSFTADTGFGVVARYNLDGDAVDLSGNGHDGAVSGTLQIADRLSNPASALQFDGIDDLIQVPHSADFNFGTGPFTVSLWLKTTAETNYGNWRDDVLSKGDPTISGFAISTQSNRAMFFVGSTGEFMGTSAINDGVWHHVVGTRGVDGSVYLYVDGVLERSSTNTGSVTTATDLFIGRHGTMAASFFDGAVDNVVVLGRMVEADEVLSLYSE